LQKKMPVAFGRNGTDFRRHRTPFSAPQPDRRTPFIHGRLSFDRAIAAPQLGLTAIPPLLYSEPTLWCLIR
jgi:hypothetical protein